MLSDPSIIKVETEVDGDNAVLHLRSVPLTSVVLYIALEAKFAHSILSKLSYPIQKLELIWTISNLLLLNK